MDRQYFNLNILYIEILLYILVLFVNKYVKDTEMIFYRKFFLQFLYIYSYMYLYYSYG